MWTNNQSVILIDEIDYDFHHCILLLGAAFGYHQCKGDKGIVGDTF